MIFKGISVSDGIAIGRTRIIKQNISFEKYSIENIDLELDRYKNAVINVKKELFETIDKIEEADVEQKIDVNIFKAHVQILEDPVFYKEVYNRIRLKKKNAEWIVNEVVDELVEKFSQAESELIKERAFDIKDVGRRIILNLNNGTEESYEGLQGFIVVAPELTPTQLLHLAEQGVAGICTEKGGRDSHVAIFSRALEIPALTGVKNVTQYVSEGDFIVINSTEGEVFLNLTDIEIKKYIALMEEFQKMNSQKMEAVKIPAQTTDKLKINLSANIQLFSEFMKMKKYGVENIGLYRTEFMFMDRSDIPSEDEQYNHYSKIVEKLQGNSIVIRMADIGGDKSVAGVTDIRNENNPFLGWRGIRILLDRRDIFKTQLKAIYRAGVNGNVKVMYPMISLPGEVDEILNINEEVRNELLNENKTFNPDIKHGILLEVPSAVLYMDYFVEKMDFFSIGTNDLLQFLLAVDRMNFRISDLYCWYNKALFLVIKHIAEICKNNNKELQICGEMAADPICLPVFIGMGITDFSMVPSATTQIKLLLRNISVDDCKEITNNVLKLHKNLEIRRYLTENFLKFMGREESK
ncbi:MAG: phosphoenolpyruvate--protein phosphotransferase [Candidatus Muiribacteriota bacterium]